jgi:hypothetical protein
MNKANVCHVHGRVRVGDNPDAGLFQPHHHGDIFKLDLGEGCGGVVLEEESILSAVSNHLRHYSKVVDFCVLGNFIFTTWVCALVSASISMGSSPGGGALPPGDALASKA